MVLQSSSIEPWKQYKPETLDFRVLGVENSCVLLPGGFAPGARFPGAAFNWVAVRNLK